MVFSFLPYLGKGGGPKGSKPWAGVGLRGGGSKALLGALFTPTPPGKAR